MTYNSLSNLDKQTVESTGNPSIKYNGSLNSYNLDGVEPRSVYCPKDIAQVEAVVGASADNNVNIVPWGGGTRIHTGNITGKYETVIDMSALCEIKEYEPDDLTVITGAGITLKELNNTLAEHNQFLPLNPPHTDKATIGGVLASDSYGFLRDAYGTARDMTLGVRFVRADGSSIKGGGKVAKNVAGYDLTRLMIGSWGTLGVITEAALRVSPVPESSKTLLANFKDLSTACMTAFEVMNAHYSPSFTLNISKSLFVNGYNYNGFISSDTLYCLVFGLDGIAETVSWQEKQIKEICKKNNDIDTNLLEEKESGRFRRFVQNYPSADFKGVICKVITTRTGLENLLEFVKEKSTAFGIEIETLCYAGSGISYVMLPLSWESTTAREEPDSNVKDKILKFVRSLQVFANDTGGYCTLESAPLWLKKKCVIWQDIPGLKLMQKIKKQLDPDNILNPDRFITFS